MKTYIYTLLIIIFGTVPNVCFSQKIDAFRGCERTQSIAGFAEFGMFRYRNNILKTIEHDPRCEIVRLGLPNSKSGVEFRYGGGIEYALGLPGYDWTYYLYFGQHPNPTLLNQITIQLQNPDQHSKDFHEKNLNKVVEYFSTYFGFQPKIKHKETYDYYEWSNSTYYVNFLYQSNPSCLPFIRIGIERK